VVIVTNDECAGTVVHYRYTQKHNTAIDDLFIRTKAISGTDRKENQLQ